MKKITLLLISLLLAAGSYAQNVAISDGASAPTPNASAVLDLQSTTKGFLAPRMTQTQREGITWTNGLLVFQTDVPIGYYYLDQYNESWKKIASTTDIQWTTSGSNIYYNSGNVGIGTTSPLSKLSVEGGAFTTYCGFGNTSPRPTVGTSRIAGEIAGVGSSLGADDGFLRLSAGGGSASSVKSFIDLSGYSTVTDMLNNIVFGTEGTERMRIDNSGNVGIGTTSPNTRLTVAEDASFLGINVRSARTGTTWRDITTTILEGSGANNNFHGSVAIKFHHNDNQDYSSDLSFWTKDGAGSQYERMRIAYNGYVGIGTTTPGYTLTVAGTAWVTSGAWSGSDSRWKTNVNKLNGALDKIMLLEGVSFDWKIDEYPEMNFENTPQIGFIAQDVEKVIPQIVTTNSDGFKGMDYAKLTPVLVNAIQEQQAEIEALKKELEEIKKVLQYKK